MEEIADNKEIPEPIEKLIKFCLYQTAKGNDFFFHFSGHINSIDVRGYSGKWMMGKESIEGFSCRIDEIDSKKADAWIRRFENKL